jgi:hypothetical protein
MTCTGATACFLSILYFRHVYRDVILSDNLHHSSLRHCHVIAGSTTLFAIQFYLVLGSCVLVQGIALNIRFMLPMYEEGA